MTKSKSDLPPVNDYTLHSPTLKRPAFFRRDPFNVAEIAILAASLALAIFGADIVIVHFIHAAARFFHEFRAAL